MSARQFIKSWILVNINMINKKAIKQKSKKVELKEIKLRPVTEVHDYTFKLKCSKFLSKGIK